ncbi:MAG: SDR family NAD(P)-dependent oxidoreductase [Streptomycetaceae bacterium]|nr:SDR family NAD(P)-dependent oxidoreductase [Streptomycetaceae bacterium]
MDLLTPPLVVSGDTSEEVAAAADRLLHQGIESASYEELRDLSYRLLTRDHADRRAAVIARGRPELLRGLAALAHGRTSRHVITGTAGVAHKPVLVFPGQGIQWPGMAAQLLASSPAFRERLEGYGQVLRPHLGWDPAAALVAADDLTQLATIQPAQFALASALADSWRAYGLCETAVVGHSVGEVAAAHACGAVSTQEAARLVALCATALTRIEGQGAMATIAARPERVGPLLDRWGARLGIAAVNSARNVTVSGQAQAVEELLAQLANEGLWAWKVPGINVAGHSPQVEDLREIMLGQAPHTPSGSGTQRAAFYSTVTGSRLESAELTALHWFCTLRGTVLFDKAVRALIEDGHHLFIEVSAHPALTTVIGETLRSAGVPGAAILTLDRRKNDQESFLHALTHAFVNGVPIRWERAYEQLLTCPQAAAAHQRTPQPPVQPCAAWPAGTGAPASAGVPTAGELFESTALHEASPSQQCEILVEVIARETSAVLGHAFSAATQTFLEAGFTSLSVVELARALSAATGLDLPPTLLFDHPTPLALATYLRGELGLEPASQQPAAYAPERAPTANEPIAIVGIGCRFPGAVTSAQSLWSLVLAGRTAMGDYPTDRGWDTRSLYDPAPGRLGKISSRAGGFLYDAADFDAAFFGLSPREATAMEPQQRLLLEVSWEAIEHAGIDPQSLRGTSTGVFAGMISQEYGPRLHQACDDVAGHAFMGTAACVASGRIAYVLGLRGPAITMDTACSSSLVAIHQACQALRHNDCQLALAGGATVMAGPGVLVEFSRQRVLAPDGRCKAFSASADGIALAEGVGMVLLERLSDAQAHGHHILAVIRGSAVNQDGASNGLTAPSGSAQQQVIRQALANARLAPQDIDAIEAHGTGTPLGDPIEAQALLATYGHQRPAGGPVWLGSIKSNIGHTQAAAGVAGLIKMVMALQEGLLPKTLHIDAPSPHVDWSTGAIQLLTEQQQWPDLQGRPRRAAVSSFGVSGTNSHLIVEQSPAPCPPAPGSTSTAHGSACERTEAPFAAVWPLSAKSETALRAQAARLRHYAISHPGADLADVGYSLGTTRSHFPHRAVLWGRSRDQLLEGLHALGESQAHPNLAQGVVPATGPGKLVFVFPGQGSQWPGMGMELYDAFPAYRQALEEADEALRPFTQWSVLEVLRGDPQAPALERVDVIQPALFAVTTSLARLWQSLGLIPHAVVGHSQGEIAAAHFAGALTLHDAAKWVALRAQALAALSGSGAMAALGLPADQAHTLLDRYDARLSIAAVNSPASTVITGEPAALTEFLQQCEAQGVRARRIDVGYASHSRHIDPLREDLLAHLADLSPRPTTVAFHSTVDGYVGSPLPGTALDATYWYDNLRNRVCLAQTIASLAGQSHQSFLECSPHPVLVPALEETLATTALVVGTLHRTKPQSESLTAAMARLHAHGHNLHWRALYPAADRVDLPTYPFDRRRYWLTPAPPADVAAAGQQTVEHPLLSAAIDLPDNEGLLLTGRIGLATHPWLADHAATAVVLVPGTAYLDMVLYAAGLTKCPHIAELTLHAPLVLPDQDAIDLQLRIGPPDDEEHRCVTVHARPRTAEEADPPAWTLHATARLTRQPLVHRPAGGPHPWPPHDAQPIDVAELRKGLAAAGYDYGQAFAGLRCAWRQGEHLYAEAHLPDGLSSAGHIVHPALLDAALHPIALPETAQEEADEQAGVRLPFNFTGITCVGRPTTQVRLHLHRTKPDTVSVVATDETGALVLTIDALTLRSTTGDHLRRLVRTSPDHDLLHLRWSPLPTALAAADACETTGWALLQTNAQLTAAIKAVPGYAQLSSLVAAIESGTAPPKVVIWPLPAQQGTQAEQVPGAARTLCRQVLDFLQAWLAHDQLQRTVLAVVTRHAVVTGPHDPPCLAHGPAWGLLHTAQNEHPGRIVLVDTDHHPDSLTALSATLAAGHSQSALREGQPHIPHLARTSPTETLTPPSPAPLWRLDNTGESGLDTLALVPALEAAAPLQPGQVRIDVRAAGVNFYDTAAALGLIPPQHDLGAEAAGVVTETGPGVEGLAAGDRVMALTYKAFGPVALADHRMVARILDQWSFAQAAGVPVAFVTAYHALVDLAGIQPGETVLIHSAAGGVGQAATQLARHLGAHPFGTAHPSKWQTLRRLGYRDECIASSRTLDFATRFKETTGGRGVDVVLNSLAGPFTDASMDLLAPGGRFIELGKTDIRDARHLATTHPHLTYQAFDRRTSASPERTAQILTELLRLFQAGVLTPLPVTAYGIRHAPHAFKLMQNARHTGKILLTFDRPLDPAGTVLITGGTGTLGGLLARHLVTAHGVRHLLLASRGGPQAAAARLLRADLESAGAHVEITACDAADAHALKHLIDSVPPEHPLTGVFHTAGVLSDATVTNLTPGDFHKVFAPKVDAAWHLHEYTRHLDLAAFVLYSSCAGTFGNPGQGNYAAANTFLDALAHHRRRQGLPGTSLAWGWWQPVTGLTGGLTDTDNTRIARTGLAPLAADYGHALLDAALQLPHPVLTAAPLNQQTLRDNSHRGTLHPLLERLTAATAGPRTRTAPRPTADLRHDLAALTAEARVRHLQTLIAEHAAAVLGLDATASCAPAQPFKTLGFDSLTALELRNRLTTATGLQLPATLTYDCPTPAALACHLGEQLFPPSEQDRTKDPATTAADARIHQAIASIPLSRLRELGLLETLLQIAQSDTDLAAAGDHPSIEDIKTASTDELLALAWSTQEPS